MRDNQIYLGGAITGIPWNQAADWRTDLSDMIFNVTSGRWTCFNPCDHISDFPQFNMNDKEALDYDLFQLLRSDLMIVNFAHNPKSIGTIAEMGAAYTYHIPILGLNEEKRTDLHCWCVGMCQVIFDDLNQLVTYLVRHYLNEK